MNDKPNTGCTSCDTVLTDRLKSLRAARFASKRKKAERKQYGKDRSKDANKI